MKQQMTLRSFLVVTCLLLGLSLHAQTRTIHVATPGTLSTYIPSYEKYEITSLTLTGDLNGTDIRYIREMAGSTYTTSGKLSVLDLSGANIVKGGDTYYNYDYSSKDTIGSRMFYLLHLTSISIPNSVTWIANDAFGSSELNTVIIGNSVTSIGDNAFYYCSKLTSATLPDNVTSIGNYAFSYCSGLTSLTMGNSVTSIGGSAFSGCGSLTSVTLPDGVTSIADCAFLNCSGLSSVTIGKSITSIGTAAFSGCTALTSIVSSNPEPPVASEATFENVGANKCKIYVPVGSKQKYEEAIGWDKFSNIIESNDLGTINISLSISSGEAGAIELIMRKGDTFTFKVVPSIGWKVNTVLFNALDVTSQLDAQNQFTTPMLEANSTIRISFEKTVSSVDQVETSNIKLFSEGEFIVIEGTEAGQPIQVYTESGVLVQTTQATGSSIRIAVPRGQTYLIKTMKRSFKIAL